jgi:hypothetical protein
VPTGKVSDRDLLRYLLAAFGELTTKNYKTHVTSGYVTASPFPRILIDQR